MDIRSPLDLESAKDIKDGDELRNLNSYEYLRNIYDEMNKIVRESLNQDFIKDLPPLSELFKHFKDHPEYDGSIAYGDMYTQFLLNLEDNKDALFQKIVDEKERIKDKKKLHEAKVQIFRESHPEGKELTGLDKFTAKQIESEGETLLKPSPLISVINTAFSTVYANPNQSLKRAYNMVEHIVTDPQTLQTTSEVEENVRARMKGKGETFAEKFKNNFNYLLGYRDLNKTTPQQEGSLTGRAASNLTKNFKPQTTTSMSSIRSYRYKEDENGLPTGDYPTEYRFGTQGQYHDGNARISPMFQAWLEIEKAKLPEDVRETKKTHVYFNLLGLDRTDKEGLREKGLTDQLHALENDPKYSNIAVITLPADKGLMDKHFLEKHTEDGHIWDQFNRIMKIATGESTEVTKDFYISPAVKKLLYGEKNGTHDKDNEHKILSDLLYKSFHDLGLSNKENISPAELQAVYFHFMKYELPNFIIDKLEVKSFNMSCKDAIDRGGVASAYFNLMKSLETDKPFTKEEFLQALHAAPTAVKGRGMNHHTRLIWNAIDKYLNNNPQVGENLAWLKEWRDDHAPKNSKVKTIKDLDTYIMNRSEKENKYTAFGTHDKETKMAAATKLKLLAKGADITFTEKEAAALKQGKLGNIYDQMVKTGMIKPESVRIEQHVELRHN